MKMHMRRKDDKTLTSCGRGTEFVDWTTIVDKVTCGRCLASATKDLEKKLTTPKQEKNQPKKTTLLQTEAPVLQSRGAWIEERFQALNMAILHSLNNDLAVDLDWIEDRNRLVPELGEAYLRSRREYRATLDKE